MSVEVTVTKVKNLLKSERVQGLIAQQVVDNFDNGKKARADREDVWLKCWRAYNRFVPKDRYKKQVWRSKIVVSWSYEAVEYAVTELMGMLFPDDEDFFAVAPVRPGDEAQEINGEVMTRYIKYLLHKCGFLNQYTMFLKQLLIIGATAGKIYWKLDVKERSTTQLDPMTLQPTRTTEEVIDYDAPYFEPINMDDFVLYPATGDLRKAMCIHRVHRSWHDIKDNKVYQNLSKLKEHIARDKNFKASTTDPQRTLTTELNQTFGINEDFINQDDHIEILEAWGDFVIDGEKYRNYIATVANRKTLLRFEPNPYDYGAKPFVFVTVKPVPGQLYGIGLIEPALSQQSMGSTITNMMLDELKLKIHGQYKFTPDGVFNPNDFVVKPGGCHAVGDIENLVPINPNLNLNVGFQEIQLLKSEFEETTGVTKYSKGVESGSGVARTAREAVLLNQASSKMFARMAKHINDTGLEPIIELFYNYLRQFGNIEEIANYSGIDPMMLMMIQSPMDEMQIKITGLQTSLLKQTNVENIERFVTGVSSTPWAMMINGAKLLEKYYRNLGFEDSDGILLPPEILQMMQQQQLMMALGPMLGLNQPQPQDGEEDGTDGESDRGLVDEGDVEQNAESLISMDRIMREGQ